MSQRFRPKLVHLVAGTRPNFMKIAPLFHGIKTETRLRSVIVHTGQHYDANMSSSFFDDLHLPEPDVHLGVGSGTHAHQTAGILVGYETICLQEKPDLIVVVGDGNSTLAAALAAKKLQMKVVHLEAGLRSHDFSMPEEINRKMVDAISDFYWTPSEDADQNLMSEGVNPSRLFRIGNIMMDSYEMLRSRIESNLRYRDVVPFDRYGVVTLHRVSNVDHEERLLQVLRALKESSSMLPFVFPIHPRTKSRLKDYLHSFLKDPHICCVEPMSYVDFMSLVRSAQVVVTDSGGLQEETSYLGIPCLTLRSNTERPITLRLGTNQLIEPRMMPEKISSLLCAAEMNRPVIPLWDGQASLRALESLRNILL